MSIECIGMPGCSNKVPGGGAVYCSDCLSVICKKCGQKKQKYAACIPCRGKHLVSLMVSDGLSERKAINEVDSYFK